MSSATNVPIQDKEEVTVMIINNVDLQIINLDLTKYVDVMVIFKHDLKFLKSQTVRIEGAEYDAWGNNDEYLINLVLQKLGLHRLT
jgi:hypothetical protein